MFHNKLVVRFYTSILFIVDDFKVSVQNHDKVITLVKNGDLSALINGLTKLQGFILQNAKPDHGMLDASILLGSAIEKFCQARYEQEKTRYHPNGTINEGISIC